MAGLLQKRLPDARIGIVHGTMAQTEIASALHAMAAGDADIPVCPTILDTGIDISHATTPITSAADNLCLALPHHIPMRR